MRKEEQAPSSPFWLWAMVGTPLPHNMGPRARSRGVAWGFRILLPTRDGRAELNGKEEVPWGQVTRSQGEGCASPIKTGGLWERWPITLSSLRFSLRHSLRTGLSSGHGGSAQMKACHALPTARPVGLAKPLAVDNLKQGPRLPSQGGAHALAGGE